MNERSGGYRGNGLLPRQLDDGDVSSLEIDITSFLCLSTFNNPQATLSSVETPYMYSRIQ